MRSFDIIVIGAGHNSLACAALLAKSKRRVLMLEAGLQIGGAARTAEFAPGYKVSPVAHIVNQIDPAVIAALDLGRYGLELSPAILPTTLLSPDGRNLVMRGGFGETIDGDLSKADLAAWRELRAKLLKLADRLGRMLSETPPRLKNGELADWMTLGKLGLAVRGLGRESMRELLRMILMNIADVLEEEIEDDLLKGAVAFDAVLGNHFGPRSPNTLLTLLYRLAGQVAGVQGAVALPKGGMGAVAKAFHAAARASGVTVETNVKVEKILIEDHSVAGVLTGPGEKIAAKLVVSGTDPHQTLLELVGPRHLDTEFVRRVRNFRARGNVARIHIALNGMPRFNGVEGKDMAGRFLVAPSVNALEKAFDASKYGHFSPNPALEIVVPTVADQSFAPAGHHVLSINAIYAPYALNGGCNEEQRAGFLERVLATLDTVSAGLRQQIVGTEVLTPADLEARYCLPGGHWHHGELAVDQMFMLRPVPETAQYETPLKGLWLCGAGSHPGGGIRGLAGLNAAKRILKQRAV
ncbi:NAD(P)/FAD-dependent oxidoreductase [Mesorhizobium ciceri]|uniref:phytoene desaturase family protein n=1 Tax=Mesorhizobium TaxID=68287 RepID=UPI0007A95AA2|nr:NAD(P)/FAD-dependent oxidoreductase [Mesorhizobium ciceri]AMX98897.1 phytoene dehydrogenase [Mesorhizobium ciceri biovar biserrulae]